MQRGSAPTSCVGSSNGLNSVQRPPGRAGTGREWSSRIRPSRHCSVPADRPRPAVSVGAAKSPHAVLLTDAQLVSDGHSSLVFNGARVQMKAGGPFYVRASSWFSSPWFPLELENVISEMSDRYFYLFVLTSNTNVPVGRLIAALNQATSLIHRFSFANLKIFSSCALFSALLTAS